MVTLNFKYKFHNNLYILSDGQKISKMKVKSQSVNSMFGKIPKTRNQGKSTDPRPAKASR
jgi:hypothetical protein